MKLVPKRPPGPNVRKARAFAAEIVDLRAQGYTFEAIREALADAGVAVSNTTVQREAARAVNRPGPVSRMPIPAAVAKDGPGRLATVAVPSATETSVPPPRDRLSGRAVAEAFFSTQITNPLIREKEQR